MANTIFKVAIATTDDIHVDSHFGHVKEVTIYEVDENTGLGKPVERRELKQAACQGGECSAGGCGHGAFREIAEQLSDVEYVLAARIGPKVLQILSQYGITGLDAAVPIEDALHKVADYRSRRTIRALRAKRYLELNGLDVGSLN